MNMKRLSNKQIADMIKVADFSDEKGWHSTEMYLRSTALTSRVSVELLQRILEGGK